MQIIDLFSGIGGFSLAGHWAGWRTIQFCEINKDCHTILRHHFPGIPIHEDIKTLDFNHIKNNPLYDPMETTIVTGGVPCQPWSTAGKRKGVNDIRNLWPESIEFIKQLRPKYAVLENVRGLISWNGGVVFNSVQSDLETAGYEVFPVVLPACGVNAPHRRDRVWFVGYRHDRSGTGNGQKQEFSFTDKGANAFGTGEIPGTNDEVRDDRHPQRTGLEGGVRSSGAEGFKPGCEGYDDTNTDSKRMEGSKEIKRERGECESIWGEVRDTIGTISGIGDAPNPGGIGQQGQGRDAQSSNPEAGSDGQADWFNNGDERWERFPVVSPVRHRTHGLPPGMAGITVSKWSKISIMQLGNSIVPQVAYQIFKAINEVESNKVTN